MILADLLSQDEAIEVTKKATKKANDRWEYCELRDTVE